MVKTITEVLKHEPGALCALINAVLSIDDDSGVSLINTNLIITKLLQ